MPAAALARALGALTFEPAPHLAVAVSGGGDSLALLDLAADWAAARGGRVTALTVDHGLRPAAAEEAAWVARRCAAAGIAHVTLAGRIAPGGNLQARARSLRHDLLGGWCRRQGVLHLLLGHNRDDQAETLLLRLGRGSGLDGLAAMAPVVETEWGRVIRPLLGVGRDALRAWLAGRGAAWLEDPSNDDPIHGRVRMRALLPALAAEGLSPERLAATAAGLGRARAAQEDQLAALIARTVAWQADGWARLDPAPLARAPDETALRALAALITTIGTGDHSPRLAGLRGLMAAVTAPGRRRARTLGGCRLVPRGGHWLVVREPAAIGPDIPLKPGERAVWDRRLVVWAGPAAAGWRIAPAPPGAEEGRDLPGPVRPGLPALWRGPAAGPVLRVEGGRGAGESPIIRLLWYAPPRAMTGGGVMWHEDGLPMPADALSLK